MGTTLTARVSDSLSEALEEISEEEKIDKSTLARRMLGKAVKKHRMERAVERFEEGEITLRKAAGEAEVPLWRFLKEIKERDIRFPYTEEDLEEDLKAVRNE